jgi:CBS domain-containing protein
MQVQDIMTTNLVTVTPGTTVSEVARTLLAHNVAAVPVVDAKDSVLGVVSETDLMRRPETGTLSRRSWLAYFDDPATLAAQYIHSHGTKAEDVMNKQVRSVTPDTDLLDAVDLMEKQRLRRILVIGNGRLQGIVCRSDLLRGLLASKEKAVASEGDRAIRALLLEELRDQPWRGIAGSNITVADGVVSLWGETGSEEESKALSVAAENIPGVRRVEDHTTMRLEVLPPLV